MKLLVGNNTKMYSSLFTDKTLYGFYSLTTKEINEEYFYSPNNEPIYFLKILGSQKNAGLLLTLTELVF